jgi:hypothetical protein
MTLIWKELMANSLTFFFRIVAISSAKILSSNKIFRIILLYRYGTMFVDLKREMPLLFSLDIESKGFAPLEQVEQKQQPSQQQAEETLYAEPILVNQSKPNPLGRIYSPIGKL